MRFTTRELLALMVVMGNASAVAVFIIPTDPALFWGISLTVAGLASSSYVIGVVVGRTNQPVEISKPTAASTGTTA